MALGLVTQEVPNAGYVFHSRNKHTLVESSNFSSEEMKTDDSGEGRIIGFTALPYEGTNISYGMKAQYAPASTKDDPVILVTSNYGGETVSYNVHINEVNPWKASELEMFALFSYTDDVGESVGGTYGSYHKMKVYAENARMNGYWDGNASFENIINDKHNWPKIIIAMWDDYAKAGLYSQMVNCINLDNTMESYCIHFVDSENMKAVDMSAQASLKYMGPDVPLEVRRAWYEAVEEIDPNGLAMGEKNGMITHITAMLIPRIEKWMQNDESKDALENSIASALKAAREALQDLEYPLTKEIMNLLEVQEEIRKEKEFYLSFIDKLEKLQKNSGIALRLNDRVEETGNTEDDSNVDYANMIKEYIENLFVKVQNGDMEPSVQIGGRSFTVKEWEDFLEKFDSIEDAIRSITEENTKKNVEASRQSVDEDDKINMIISDTIQARFLLQEKDSQGNRKEDVYFTHMDKDGVRCVKSGADSYEWEIKFKNKEQYEKAAEFMKKAGEYMDNFLFSANKNFWEDLISGDLDIEAFQEFLKGTNNGVPNYGITIGDSTYIDESKVQWAKYMNNPAAKFYTAKEMADMVAAEIRKNTAKLKKIETPCTEIYKKYHPEYHGEAIFCKYPGGQLYTVEEVGGLIYRRALRLRNREVV